MSIIITGASGDLGAMVTDIVLETLPPQDLVLVSRRPDALHHLARRGVEVRFGDFDQPASLQTAFAGGQSMLLISATDVGERRRRQHAAAVDAAVAAGIGHIAYTSSAGIHPSNPCFVIPDHIFTEKHLVQSIENFTILRINSYADILVKAIAPQALASGQWISSAGDGLAGFVDKRDCARAAAAVLTTPGHRGAIYEITGPELLSHRHVAAMVAEISGRPIEYVVPAETPPDSPTGGDPTEAETDQASKWIGTFSIDDLKSFEYAVRDGYYAICSRHIEMITRRPARSVREAFLAAANAQGLAER